MVTVVGSEPPWRARALAALPQRGSGQGPQVRAEAAFASGVSSTPGLQRATHLVSSRPGSPGPGDSVVHAGSGAQVVATDASFWSFLNRQLQSGGDAGEARQAQRQDRGAGARTADFDQAARAPGEHDPSRPIAPRALADPSAAYLDGWRREMERVGSLNFPWSALTMGESQRLTLEVSLRADGTVAHTRVSRSSGLPMLDKAAVGILLLASPYEPFPESLRRHASELTFAYDWEFLAGDAASVRVGR